MKIDTGNPANTVAVSTDDAVGADTDAELRNRLAAVDTAAVVVADVAAAAAAGVDDNDGHDDADAGDTIRYCIHPCHTEVTALPTRTCPQRDVKNETAHTHTYTHRWQTYQSSIEI